MQRELEELKRHARMVQLALESFISTAEALGTAIAKQQEELARAADHGPLGLDALKQLNPAQLLSTKRVAEILGVSVQTMQQWRHHKRYPLPYVKVGGRVMYRLEDVARFIEARTEKR